MTDVDSILLFAPDELHPHEEVDETVVDRVVAMFRETGEFYPPLLIDRKTKVVLDGHHRLVASRQLGCKRVPCYCVDYLHDKNVRLESWRPDTTLTKQEVLQVGISGEIFPQKTTRHIYELPNSAKPIPLKELTD